MADVEVPFEQWPPSEEEKLAATHEKNKLATQKRRARMKAFATMADWYKGVKALHMMAKIREAL